MEDINSKKKNEFINNYGLLDIQQIAVLITIYSDLLSYSAVLEGKGLLEANYNNEEGIGYNPDEIALQSLYIYFISKLLFTGVGIQRYNYLYNKVIDGEVKYSIEPNININIGNIFGLIGLYFLIQGAEGIYARDNLQPVFGVR